MKLLNVSRQAHEEEISRWTKHENLNHTKWECKYHVVFIPKCRRKVLYGELRRILGEVFRALASRRRAGSRRGT